LNAQEHSAQDAHPVSCCKNLTDFQVQVEEGNKVGILLHEIVVQLQHREALQHRHSLVQVLLGWVFRV